MPSNNKPTFIQPYYLNYADPDTIQRRMLYSILELMPNIDISENSFMFDTTKPYAMELARLVQFNLTEVQKNGFPQFAYGDRLDDHAWDRNMMRRNPLQAYGTVTITGEPGTVIERGTVVITIGQDGRNGIEFETLDRVTIPDEGSIDVEIRAVNGGSSGNVGANTITALKEPVSGIKDITNAVMTSGGEDIEDDETLRERILIYDRKPNMSYAGTEWDYLVWALEVPGVGFVRVQGCDDGSGTVTLMITDTNGRPASEHLINEVYNHIMSPGDPQNKKAPINSKLIIKAPEILEINVEAELYLDSQVSPGDIEESLEVVISEYINNLMADLTLIGWSEGTDTITIKIHDICSKILEIYGVKDYDMVLLNGEPRNIKVGVDYIPVVGKMKVTGLK